MSHTTTALEWNLEGSQDFTVRMSRLIPDGVTITTIDSIVLQRRIGNSPEVWEDTATVPSGSAIVSDDFDPNNPVPNAAVYFTVAADTDGDPIPGGGPYRWLIVVTLSNALNEVAKIPLTILP